jgi:hypothetical protein
MEMRAVEDRIQALNEERNRIASDLHDDIGASLSGIRIYTEAALMQASKNPDEAFQLLGRIRQSAAGVMERMGDIVWSISPRNDSGENMLFRMKTFATETLGPLGILPQYEADEKGGESAPEHPCTQEHVSHIQGSSEQHGQIWQGNGGQDTSPSC